ncbi:MAG: hypothetical protein U0Y10_10020 [Spirosomataceae bacterium]
MKTLVKLLMLGGVLVGCQTNGNLSPSLAGTGGSMARFAIVGDNLYTVSNTTLTLFDISTETNPIKSKDIKLGFGIETIFPYQSNLFIGTQTGMKIYDNSNSLNPVEISTYAHVTSCDPVVVQGQYAYVTLRNGTACRNGSNLLEVVDLSNLKEPKLIKSIQMSNPHGLGVDAKDLFVCEGDFGLKVFDLTDPANPQLTQSISDVRSYDVIPQNKLLILTGKDGIYQYDYSNRKQLKPISKIPTE